MSKTKVTKTKGLDVNSIIKKGITEKYDGIAIIGTLLMNPSNQNMYGKYEDDHILSIQTSVLKDGLKNPIVLYKDGKTIKSGHNRVLALKKAGFEEVPYILSEEERPKSQLQEMISLAIENMGRPANIGRSFFSVKKMCKIYSDENNGFEPKSDDIKGYCAYHQIGYDSFVKIKKIEIEAPDLFDKVVSSNMAITAAINELTMRSQSIIKLSETPFMNGLLGHQEINYGLGCVTAVKNKIDSITINKPGGTEGKAFEEIQPNTMGGIVHEIFTNAIRDIVNYKHKSSVLSAPKNSSLYDLEAVDYNSGIETKTCVTESGKKPRWVTHRYKDGYVLLLSITPNGKRALAGYGVIPGSCWKPGKPIGTIDLVKLAEIPNFNWVYGSLELEDGKAVATHDKISL